MRMRQILKNYYCFKTKSRVTIGETINYCMKVVITPAFPLLSNEDMLQWNDMLVQLKEEGIVNHLMSISEFKLLCMERGLNEFRKDLRVFDC